MGASSKPLLGLSGTVSMNCSGVCRDLSTDNTNCGACGNVCPAGQFCYTHTVYACGLPCTAFVGDVCPFVAPGSFCNATTQQCEFP